MLLTPSSSGSLIAGAGLGVFSWSAFLKATKIPFLGRFMTKQRQEQTLNWMNRNKGITLLGMETVNLGIHGITNSNGVLFAGGNTIFNVIMLFLWLPFRQHKHKQQHLQTVLKGARTS